MKRLFLCLALLGTPLAAQGLPPGQAEEEGFSSERLARIDTLLERAVRRGAIAGAVSLVARNGRVVALDTVGFQDIARGVPMRSGTIFRIASMSKAITSAAAMILVEEGRLRLDDAIARYIPGFAEAMVATKGALVDARRPITIHDLLTHRSGITYGFIDDGAVGDAYRAAGISDGMEQNGEPLAANVGRLAKLPLVAQPGAGFHYGLSTDVLGRVIEIVSGRTLAEFLEERLFAPLGMDDTGFYVEDGALDRLAVPYTRSGGDTLRPVREVERFGNLSLPGQGYRGSRVYFSGGSGLASTAGDYARFLQMVLNGGELDGVRVLAPKTVELMTVDATADMKPGPLGAGSGFTLGFEVLTDVGLAGRYGSVGTISWTGIYGTSFWADPEEGLIGVLMLQLFPSEGLHLSEVFRTLAYAALVE